MSRFDLRRYSLACSSQVRLYHRHPLGGLKNHSTLNLDRFQARKSVFQANMISRFFNNGKQLCVQQKGSTETNGNAKNSGSIKVELINNESSSKEETKLPSELLVGTGTMAGVASALTGIGGGILMIPTLRNFTSLTQHECSSTSLLTATISATMSSLTYLAYNVVNIPVALTWAISSAIMVKYGVKIAGNLNSQTLTKYLGVFLLVLSPLPLLNKKKRHDDGEKEESLESMLEIAEPIGSLGLGYYVDTDSIIKYGRLVIVGGLSGVMTGVFGLGGGMVMVPYFSLVEEMPQINAVATSLFSIIPTGLLGTYHNAKLGNVRFKASIVLATASSATAFVVANYVGKGNVDEQTLKYLFSGILVLSSVATFRRAMV